jgi:hypothetical protein
MINGQIRLSDKLLRLGEYLQYVEKRFNKSKELLSSIERQGVFVRVVAMQ